MPDNNDLNQTTPAINNTEKDPKDWITGDEPATGAQLSYVTTMASTAGRDVPDNLTKAAASKLIEELQAETK